MAMDTFFITHGDPTILIDEKLPARHFMTSWQEEIFPTRPKSVLVVSAHWETPEPTVNVVVRNDTIHDFTDYPKIMYEEMDGEADIPVLQLSVQPEMDGEHHYNMGRALAPLRDEGVLIIGSGSATHSIDWEGSLDGPVEPWALEFDDWLRQALVEGRHEDVNKYEERAPGARMSHPTPEHLYPLHVALGAAGERAKAELIHHSWDLHSSMSYASYRFTS